MNSVIDKNYLTVFKFEVIGEKFIAAVKIHGKTYHFLLYPDASNIIFKDLDRLVLILQFDAKIICLYSI